MTVDDMFRRATDRLIAGDPPGDRCVTCDTTCWGTWCDDCRPASVTPPWTAPRPLPAAVHRRRQVDRRIWVTVAALLAVALIAGWMR